MNESEKSIFLIVEFNWPMPPSKEAADAAKVLHTEVSKSDWISSTLAGSGGLGGVQSSIWIFELANYAALDRLLTYDDSVSIAYKTFFSTVKDVKDYIKEKVIFLS